MLKFLTDSSSATFCSDVRVDISLLYSSFLFLITILDEGWVGVFIACVYLFKCNFFNCGRNFL